MGTQHHQCRAPELFDKQAERTILGTALVAPEEVMAIAGRLLPEHFYVSDHGDLWSLMRQMEDDDEPMGLREVCYKLKDTPTACGGLAYVSQMAECVTANNVEHWVRLVANLAERRAMWERLEAAQELLIAGGSMPDVWEAVEGDVEVDESEDAPAPTKDFAAPSFMRLAETIEARKRGVTVSVPLPLAGMHRHIDLPLNEGKAILLGARPGMGKTAMALQAATCVAGAELYDPEHGTRRGRAMYFSMEMGRDELALRMACQRAKLNADYIKRGHGTAEEMLQVRDGYEYLNGLNLWVDKKPRHTLGSIRRRIERNIRQHGKLDVVVIDYIGLVDVVARHSERHDQAVSRAYRSLRECARRNKFTLWVLTQLNRKCEERANKRPIAADAKDSGGLEEHSDVVVLLYRPVVYLGDHASFDEQTQAEVIIPKSRGGTPGTARCRFNGGATLFHDGEPWRPAL